MQPRSQGSPNCPSIPQQGLVGENLVNEVERDIFFFIEALSWRLLTLISQTVLENVHRQAYYSSMNRCLALLFMIIGCDLQGRLAFLSTGVFLCKVWQIHLINTWMEWAAFSIPKHLFSLYVFFSPYKGLCMFCLPREGLRGIFPFCFIYK